jgi:hypothetical protein
MTVTEPLVASVLGVTVLGETLGADGPKLIVLVASVVVVIVATAALARGEAVSLASGDEGQLRDCRVPEAAASPVVVGATSHA